MKKTVSIVLLGVCSLLSRAQELEFTTYYAEKAEFRIDLPDKWNSAVAEVKGMMGYSTNITSVDASEEGTIAIITANYGCKSPASVAKSYKGIFQRGAKKSGDTAFRIMGEGEKPGQDGKKYYWIDFIHTLALEDGRKLVLRELFVARCHTIRLNKYSNIFRFQTLETNWEKNKPVFDKIYDTALYEEQ